MAQPLEFEKPVIELEARISELQHTAEEGGVSMSDEIDRLQKKADSLLRQTYEKLSPRQKVQVARHPERPHFKDYINQLITDFTPLSGDRGFANDHALIGGIGRFRGQSCVIIGQEKGHDTESRIKHNFGMPRPEGYRKAQRLMKMASQFKLPIITLVDTAGAYPGVGAEERGQSEAIAKSIETCLRVDVPVISVIIGEGGSGGAIAIATADKVLMLEHSIYSVISPEGCASILWRSSEYANDAAKSLKLTAQDLKKHKIIDEIIKEPVGGAHRNNTQAIDAVGNEIERVLNKLISQDSNALKSTRREKFINIGAAA